MGKVVTLSDHVTDFKPSKKKKRKADKDDAKLGNTTSSPGFYSRKSLMEASSVDFTGITTNRELFKEALKAVVDLIPVAQGLCNVRPSQSSAYAVTKLISQMQELIVKIEGLVDYNKLANEVFDAVFMPFLESHIKALGRNIRNHQEEMFKLVHEKKQRKVKELMDDVYKRYGKTLEAEIAKTRERFVKEMTKRTSKAKK